MKIRWIYEEPDEKCVKEFTDLLFFLEDDCSLPFREMFTQERFKYIEKVTVITNYPAVITVEVER